LSARGVGEWPADLATHVLGRDMRRNRRWEIHDVDEPALVPIADRADVTPITG